MLFSGEELDGAQIRLGRGRVKHVVEDSIHHIADLSEALAQVLGQLDFVFDEQNFHGAILEECRLFVDYEFVIWLLVSCRGSLSKVPLVSQGIA